MNVTVYLDQRFLRTPEGAVWTEGPCSYSFFRRYLAVFDSVQVVARVRDIAQASPNLRRACGDGVCFRAVPHYVGPGQYLIRARDVSLAARRAMGTCDGVILRVPSQIAARAGGVLRKTGRPYGVEVVGDPQDVFAPGVTKHPLRPFFRSWFRRQLRGLCAHATAASYVTSTALQSRYPAAAGAFVTYYSSAELPEEAFVVKPVKPKERLRSGPIRLINVASMESPYKGHEILLDAVASCLRGGLDVHLTFVGEGRCRPRFERRASKLKIEQRVAFRGQIPAGEAVRAELDQADLFVLPSLTEGLPRAMLEAMARGLACVGSKVGGIPELLPPEDTAPSGDSSALAAKISEIAADPARMAAMAKRSWMRARQYHDDVLQPRRRCYYEHLRRKTEIWLAENKL